MTYQIMGIKRFTMKLENIKWPHEFSTARSMDKKICQCGPVSFRSHDHLQYIQLYPFAILCIFQSVSVLKPRGTPERYCSCFFMVFFQGRCDPKIRPPASDGAAMVPSLPASSSSPPHPRSLHRFPAPWGPNDANEVNGCGEQTMGIALRISW